MMEEYGAQNIDYDCIKSALVAAYMMEKWDLLKYLSKNAFHHLQDFANDMDMHLEPLIWGEIRAYISLFGSPQPTPDILDNAIRARSISIGGSLTEDKISNKMKWDIIRVSGYGTLAEAFPIIRSLELLAKMGSERFERFLKLVPLVSDLKVDYMQRKIDEIKLQYQWT